MQCKFLIAFVLMGACLIQISSAQPSLVAETNQRSLIIDNAINTAKELIQKVIDLIQRQIDEALNTLNEIKYKITEQMRQAIDAVKQSLQEIIAKAKEAIEEIKRKAEQASIDISTCVKDNESRFQELFEKFLADEVHCATDEVDKIMNMITETIQMMTNAIDTLKNFPNELINCTTTSRPLSCIANVTIHVAEIQKNIPIQIAQKIKEVTEFVTGLQTRLQICATTQLANAGIAAAGIVGDIAKCAADKGLQQINL